MSRLLINGTNQITWTYEQHTGWSRGVDLIKYPSKLEKITAHTTGKIIKVVNYLDGTNMVHDKEGMGYGNYVMILHGSNIVTLYAHLEHVFLAEGSTINRGEILGYMANTGICYGAHLHFEIRKYCEIPRPEILHNTDYFVWINPTQYLDTELPYVEPLYERVQVGSYLIEENAKRIAEHINKLGISAIVKKYGMYYRVQVGAYTIRVNAEVMLQKMINMGFKDAFITK